MRASFDEIAGKGLARRDEVYPLIASLIRAERTHRQARSIGYRIGAAKFPVLKDLDQFVFADTPVDEVRCVNSRPAPSWTPSATESFIGGTGTGKTHVWIGVASAVIRARARGRFYNLVGLVNQLEQEKAAGRSGRLAEKLLRYDLIVAKVQALNSHTRSRRLMAFRTDSSLSTTATQRCDFDITYN